MVSSGSPSSPYRLEISLPTRVPVTRLVFLMKSLARTGLPSSRAGRHMRTSLAMSRVFSIWWSWGVVKW